MFVYVLYSDCTSKRYIGYTSDLDKRIRKHNIGRVRSTKPGIPWRMIAHKKCSSQSEARWIERSLKRSKEKLEKFLLGL